MTDLLRSELFRLSRRLMPRVLLLILAAVVLLIYLLIWLTSRNQTDIQAREDLRYLGLSEVRQVGLGLAYQIGTVLVIILAASTVGAEYGWGTIRTLLPRATGRAPFLWAKILALVLFSALVVVLGFLVALGASAVVTAVEDLGGGLGANFVTGALASLGRTIFVMLPYLALAVLVAVWSRSSAAGISVGLVVLFLEGLVTSLLSLAGDAFDWVPRALLNDNVQAVLSANTEANEGPFAPSQDLPGAWQGAGVLALYTAIFVALAYWRFRSRDVTTGG